MLHSSFPSMAVASLTSIFFVSAAIQLAGPGFVRRAYKRWDFPPKFYRVTGFVELLTALFLVTPQTRIWGAILGGLVTFAAEVTLLNHRQYFWAMPGVLLLVALIPAGLAGSS
jgi:hypothetical protein